MPLPVYNALPLQILQATAQLGRVEDRSLLLEAGVAQVVNVKLQVPHRPTDGESLGRGLAVSGFLTFWVILIPTC